jgi:hypothetical protein
MRLLQKISTVILATGLFLVLVGGMRVHRGPDGTWIQLNMVHGIGGALLLCGIILTLILAFTERHDSNK